MPYSIVIRKGKYCVVKDSSNMSMGCHVTKARAKAQMRALYAAEGRLMDAVDLSMPVRRD